MKNIAVVISSAPHGDAKGREALDLALSLSDLHHISLFFIGDGVLHLLPNQQPEVILMRNYIKSLKMLDLYDINAIYASYESLEKHNITHSNLNLDVIHINDINFRNELAKQDSLFFM